MNPTIVKQVIKKSKSIPGWFSPDAAMLFAWVDEIQKRNNIHGDAFEIGCHHGKSAVLLASLVEPGKEKLAVCDLFGMQEGNVSLSGNGDLDAFNKNMASLRNSGVNVNVFQKNSAHLTATEIGKTYRMFHVDGGHNPDEALADLLLAADCTIESGVVLLDDPFRTEWPGVTEALIRFLDQRPDWQALMVGFNKLLLARVSHSELYTRAFDEMAQRNTYGFGYPMRIKPMPFHTSELRVFHVPDYLQKKSLGNLARYVYNKSEFLQKARKKPAEAVAGTQAQGSST